ncbi:MAG: SIMPL domain-containing protein [Kiritimatiellae bacterium]|nr:SIMPL domain-containing protein [Kiritimatiellia bacterium]
MRRSAVCVLWIALLAAAAAGAGKVDQPSIDVFGTAEVVFDADAMRWSLEIETHGDTMAEAKRLNDQALERVRAALADLQGVTDFKIDNPTLGKTGSYDMKRRELKPFEVERDLWFTTRIGEKERELDDVLAQLDAVAVRCSWTATNRDELLDRARRLALLAAKEKAVSMAGVLGMKVGDPLLIEEEPSRWAATTRNIRESSVTETNVGAEVVITAKCRVIFRLERGGQEATKPAE